MAALKISRKMLEPCFSNFNLSITGIFSGSAPSFFSRKLFHKITRITLVKGVYLLGEPSTCHFDRAPQGLLPKQKHSSKVILQRSCFEKFPDFQRIEPLMKSFLS